MRIASLLVGVLVLFLALVLAGCGQASTGTNTNITTNTNTNMEIGHGWLYVDGYSYNRQGEADFLNITQNGSTLQATLTSATYSLTYVNNYNVSEPECCGEASTTLKGTINNNRVQLIYTGISDYGQETSGTFDPSTNTLTFSGNTYPFGGHTYIPGSQDDFKKAVSSVCLQAIQNGNKVTGGVCQSSLNAPAPSPSPTPKPTPTTTPKLVCGSNGGCYYPGETDGGRCYYQDGSVRPSPPWYYNASQGACIDSDASAPNAPPLICNATNQACYYQGSVTGDYCFDKNGKYLPGWVYSVGSGCEFDGANP